MKILILVTIITWSFGGGYQNSPSYQIVSSVNSAALAVYNDRPLPFMCEPDHKVYQLWEVDLEEKTFKQICIPKIVFKTNGKIPE